MKWNLFPETVTLLVTNYLGSEIIDIERKGFEKWLDDDERLSWSIDAVDSEGNIDTITIAGDKRSYWTQSTLKIASDLEQYLMYNDSELN